MNIVICEDDNAFSNLLKKKLTEHLTLRGLPCEATQFSCGAPLKEHLDAGNRVDLLFMDVQLENEDGIELVKELKKNHPKLSVIFLTSMEDRIGEGYDVNAFYYLLKKDYDTKLPVVMDRFIQEVFVKKSLYLKFGNEVLLLDYDEIYYVEANKRGAQVHCKEEVHTSAMSIQNFGKILPYWIFIEVYHALYVNADHVRRVDSDTLLLDNGETVPVSRRKRKDLMNAIMRRMQQQ
ncbi:MAG: response regulator transcription factor [Lachnospiraceae bacterium]|nr:response regulator transcription factor [Lachnospiraceae bacterium]